MDITVTNVRISFISQKLSTVLPMYNLAKHPGQQGVDTSKVPEDIDNGFRSQILLDSMATMCHV